MGLGIKLYFNLSNRERVVDKIEMYQKDIWNLWKGYAGREERRYTFHQWWE